MLTDDKARVLQAINIVELIRQSVPLKQRGKEYVGLCPFHQEKTPSFHVNPAGQFFYCYGCKAGGNAIDFVIRRDRIEFRDALEALAQQAGIELTRWAKDKDRQQISQRQALLDAHVAAGGFFANLLWHPQQGEAARKYLHERGFNDQSLRNFGVGLAADAWDALLSGPVGRKFGTQVLAAAGLVKAREGGNGHYDTFRNRILFPIRDEQGRIIAFGGRVMPGSTDPAKYLNSPETALFSKGRAVFGLDLARQQILETKTVAVVEGYTDVVMAHQFGVTNVVSVLGTAMTEQQVAMLRRFAERIVLLFDADAAGDAAVGRLVEMFLTQPVEIAIASMPAGMDPDEFLVRHGAAEFQRLLAGALDALTYAWKRLQRQFVSTEGDLTGQQKAVQQYLELLAAARGSGPVDVLRWGQALARVARLTQVPVQDLHRRFRARRSAPRRGAAQVGAKEPIVARTVADGVERSERWILGALLRQPSLWHEAQTRIGVEDFADADRRALASLYWEHQRNEGEPVLAEWLTELPPEMASLALELASEAEQLQDVEEAMESALGHLAEVRRLREERRIVSELCQPPGGRLENGKDVDLLREIQERARRPDLRRLGW